MARTETFGIRLTVLIYGSFLLRKSSRGTASPLSAKVVFTREASVQDFSFENKNKRQNLMSGLQVNAAAGAL